MASQNQATADQLTARFAADPEWQRLSQAYQAEFAKPVTRSDPERRAAGQAYRALVEYQRRIGVPQGFVLDPKTNSFEKDKGFPGWSKYAMMGIGGAAAVPFIAGALGGGAAASAGGLPGLGTAGAVGPGGAAAGGGSVGLGSTLAGLGKSLLPKGAKGWVETGLSVAGRLGKGRAAGRVEEAEQARAADRARLEQARFNRENPSARAGGAVRGDILAGLQDYQLSGEGRNLSSTGGLRPSLLSPGTRQLGSSLSREALLSQLGQGGPNDPYAAMTPTPTPQAGGLDKVLTGAGIAGDVLQLGGGLDTLPFFRRQRQQPPPPPTDDSDDIYAGLY